ncbi:M1 family metallopeptidase [uncultured Nocardioides sp.]|uniref:M1 family metallopeptidase n=1 Tax=uncultured Nocardioides sp. TaxID=198441 RepID=UPI00261A34F6|nr:M1 family metallopeptidase [uncultured Nocardioides sp.]
MSLRHVVPALALTLAGGLAVAVPTGSAAAADVPGPVDGPRTAGDSLFPHVGNGGYDVRRYDLDLRWTPAKDLARSTLDARARITADATGAPLRSFSLDFERGGMRVSSVTVDGEPARFTTQDDAERIRHKLVVRPATPVDGRFTTTVTYAGVPTRHVDEDGSAEGWNVTDDGATFLNQPIGSMTGFPNNNTPADKATYTIDVDVPRGLEAASNGVLTDRKRHGDRTWWRWVQRRPMASELAMISIGQYDVTTSRVDLGGDRSVREWSFVDPQVTGDARRATERQLGRWEEVLGGLEEVFGRYPGVSTGAVVDVVPKDVNYALETQDRSFFPSSIDGNTFVHEATHQWWGDSVSPPDWGQDLYVNEGMATWAPTYLAGRDTEQTWFDAWDRVPSGDARWTIPPGAVADSADLFGYQAYNRGAQFWEALRLAIGDEDFFTLLRTWQDTYRGGSHGTADLRSLAEDVSGEDLDAFFADWVLDADKPAWPTS